MLDQPSIVGALRRAAPDEVYNLASVSFVPASWREPVQTAEFAAVGATALLEAIRQVDPGIRFYQASSSEIFGEPVEVPQTESTPLAPVTPYGVAKAYAHFITRSYRHRYGMYACSGILYNHESPAAAGRLRHAQGRARGRGDLARARAGAAARLARRAPRLGLRGRLRARDDGHAAAGRARRLRDRERRPAQRPGAGRDRVRPCRPRLARLRARRRLAAARPRGAARPRRRRLQGARDARLGADRRPSRSSCGCSSTQTSRCCATPASAPNRPRIPP